MYYTLNTFQFQSINLNNSLYSFTLQSYNPNFINKGFKFISKGLGI